MSRDLQKAFHEVEGILARFPRECSVNYFNNKKDLKVAYVKPKVIKNGIGSYEACDNYMLIDNRYGIEVIFHELFHMAFNNRNTLLNQINAFNKDTLIANGISVLKVSENSHMEFWALNEAFVQYLANKCEGALNCYDDITLLTEILIAIHGEDILCYPLTSDYAGFVSDKRFYDIKSFAHNIDSLEAELESFEKLLKSKWYYEDPELQERIYSIRSNKIKTLYLKILNNLYAEYVNAKEKKISPNEFNYMIDRMILSGMSRFFDIDEYACKFTDSRIVLLKSAIDMESNKRVRKK